MHITNIDLGVRRVLEQELTTAGSPDVAGAATDLMECALAEFTRLFELELARSHQDTQHIGTLATKALERLRIWVRKQVNPTATD